MIGNIKTKRKTYERQVRDPAPPVSRDQCKHDGRQIFLNNTLLVATPKAFCRVDVAVVRGVIIRRRMIVR